MIWHPRPRPGLCAAAVYCRCGLLLGYVEALTAPTGYLCCGCSADLRRERDCKSPSPSDSGREGP